MSWRMRGIANAPNSPRDRIVELLRPKAVGHTEIVSKSYERQTERRRSLTIEIKYIVALPACPDARQDFLSQTVEVRLRTHHVPALSGRFTVRRRAVRRCARPRCRGGAARVRLRLGVRAPLLERRLPAVAAPALRSDRGEDEPGRDRHRRAA